MQNKSKQEEQTFVEKYITMMILLKKYCQFSQSFSSLILILPYLQLIILALEKKLTISQKSQSLHYQIIRNIIRPDIWLIESKKMDLSLLFIIVLVIFLIQKLKCVILSVMYYYYMNQDKLISLLENSLLLKGSIMILSVYLQLITIVLHQLFTLLCFQSIQQLMENLKGDQSLQNYLIIIFAFITFALFILDSLLHIQVIEHPVTLKITGIERKQINSLRFISFFLELSVQIIFVFQINSEITIHIIAILNIFMSLTNLVDQFYNQVHINNARIQATLFGISISITINILLEIIELQDRFSQRITFTTIILSPIIFQIFLHFQRKQQQSNLLSLFSPTISQPKKFIHQLICLANQNQYEFCYIQRALIQQRHYQNCNNPQCCLCGHIYILDPNSAQGITVSVYKEFVLSSLNHMLHETFKTPYNTLETYKLQKSRLLIYIFLLYDFGWVMQSLQYLHQLISTQKKKRSDNNINRVSLGTLPQINSYSDKTSHFISENQTSVSGQDQNEINIQTQISILLNQIKFSLIERVIIKITLQNARRTIKKNFGSDDGVQQQTIASEFVNFFLRNEVQVTYALNIITKLSKQKIQFYESILKHGLEESKFKFQQNQKIYDLLLKLCNKLHKNQLKLDQIYSQSSSYLLNQTICIYLSYLLNDYEKAITFSRNQKFVEEKLIKFQKIKNFNTNTKQIYYFIINLQEDMQSLKIHTYSSNCIEHFGAQKSKGERFVFEDTIPSFIQPFHHLYVRNFLEAGACKFFKTFEINFFLRKDLLLEALHMNIDNTELFSQQNLTFSVFLQPPSEEKVFLIVDSIKHYCFFTKSLLLQLGWTLEQIFLFTQTYDLSQIKIETIIPDFSDLLESLVKLTETTLSQIELSFPKPQQIQKTHFDHSSSPSKRERNSLIRSNTNILAKYLGDMHIVKRVVGNYTYYVIQIIYVEKQLGEESHPEIHSPKKNQKKFAEGDFDSEIFNLDKNECNNMMKDFQKQVLESALTLKKNAKLFANYPTDQLIEEIMSPGRICITDQRNSDRANNNNEQRELLNSHKDTHDMQAQQQFYSYDAFHRDPSSDGNDIQIKNSKLRESRTKTINEISKEAILKKYDTIHKLLNHSKPSYLLTLLAFTYLFLFSFISMAFFIMKTLTSDFNAIIDQIEMMKLHASIMGPHDLFFSMRITITSYQILYLSNFINASEFKTLTAPYYQYLPLGYQELQDNFYTQLTNPYLVYFLNDVNIEVWFMGNNASSLQPLNVTFRDNLFIMLQYQLQQLTAYMEGKSFTGQPFQIFLLANYLVMHNTCEKLTNEIKVYSIEKCNQIYLKWCLILTIFAVILCLLLILVYYYQQKLFNQFNTLIRILKHNNNDTIASEIVRYKYLVNSMSYDFVVGFKIEKDFKKIIKQQALLENAKKKQQSYQKFNQSYPQFRFNLVSFFILFYMFAYGIVVFAEAHYYLSKYAKTQEFFSLIQEMKFRAGNGFLYREMFFRFSSYSFLTNADKEDLYTLLDRSQSVQLEFNSLIQTIDYTQYLLTQDCIDLFEYVQTHQMCTLIDESFQPLMNRYCDLSFQGILNTGIVPSLAYLHNQIDTQQQINNFTKRIEMHKYELEGSQIITRAFFAISNSFSQSFVQITNYRIEDINNLSISFLIVTLILLVALIFYYNKFLMEKYELLKKIVYLIPLQVFLQDEYLERYLKEILHKTL